MRIVVGVLSVVASLAVAGCADQFRAQAPQTLIQQQEPASGGAARVSLAALPTDLAWLADAVRLFEVAGRGATVQLLGAPSVSGSTRATMSAAAMTPGPGALPGGRPAQEADLLVVSLPLAADQAGALAVVPGEVEKAVGPALLPEALRASQLDGRMLALPVSTRWLALAWNPARLTDSAAPAPPHLEAWLDQLRALRRSQPAQSPVVVAWAEQEIAGSFALLLAAHGGRLLDEAGQPAFTSEEGEAAVELMIRMFEERLVQPTALETDTRRLAASLTGPHTYWLCSSDALTAAGSGHERIAGLRLSGLPVTRARYKYPDTTAAALVQFRGMAVSRGSTRQAATWRLARFLADPVILRSSPAAGTALADPPPSGSALVRQSRSLVSGSAAAPWPEPPGLSEALGRFLHAALRRILTPGEALERAALQFRQPGALPETSSPAEAGERGTNGYPSTLGSPTATEGAASGTGGPDGGPPPALGSQSPPAAGTPAGTSAPPGAPSGYPGPGGVSTSPGGGGQKLGRGPPGSTGGALMRIAIFAESFPPVVNGAATAISLLVGALRERHHVVVYAPRFPGFRDRDENVRRFRSYRLPPEPEYPLAVPLSPGLCQEFLAAGYDVVHTHSPFTLGQLGRRWAARAGIPTVTTYHTLYTEYTHYAPWFPPGFGRHLIKSISRKYCNSCPVVTVPTEPIREVLEGYGVVRPIEVIPTGVPFGEPPALDPAFPRQALDIPPEVPVVLYAGRLAKEKNLGLLFRAFKRLRDTAPEAVLLLAGTGPWEAEARRAVEELGITSTVRFAGVLDRERLGLCYADAQVFGFPSLADTQGMVLVEAKAAGLPSVCVGVNGPAIVVRHGVDGLLVENDEEEFAAALLRVIREPRLRAKLSAAGLADSVRFSVSAMAQRYENVYQSAQRTLMAGAAATEPESEPGPPGARCAR